MTPRNHQVLKNTNKQSELGSWKSELQLRVHYGGAEHEEAKRQAACYVEMCRKFRDAHAACMDQTFQSFLASINFVGLVCFNINQTQDFWVWFGVGGVGQRLPGCVRGVECLDADGDLPPGREAFQLHPGRGVARGRGAVSLQRKL